MTHRVEWTRRDTLHSLLKAEFTKLYWKTLVEQRENYDYDVYLYPPKQRSEQDSQTVKSI